MKNYYFYILLTLFCFIDSLMYHNNLAVEVLYVGTVIWISSEDGLEIQEINLIEMQRPARGKKNPTYFNTHFLFIFCKLYVHITYTYLQGQSEEM